MYEVSPRLIACCKDSYEYVASIASGGLTAPSSATATGAVKAEHEGKRPPPGVVSWSVLLGRDNGG
jgi:hypothetical protein